MSRRGTAFAVCAGFAVALYFLYFFDLTVLGMYSTDEPRYAAIGRAMAHSGDWITPRLWGQPWFEKPALLYWMTGAATLAGLGPDLAPRLPVALASVAFLIFFYRALHREFGFRAALYSAMVLATSAGWIVYSQIAVPDLPLAVTFSAAMLLALPWLRARDTSRLPLAAAMLGLAVLAKGLVPLVLAIPLLWTARRQWIDLAKPAVIGIFTIVALPWYLICWLRNGAIFPRVFFLEHTFGRFVTPDLQHVRPFWFYAPYLIGFLFPWLFLFPLLFRRSLYDSPSTRFLLGLVVFGFLFFSAATNKLPGYLLPLLPAICALMGVALARARLAAGWLACCLALFALVPVIVWGVPVAIAEGFADAYPVDFAVRANSALLIPLLLIAGALGIFADRAGRREIPVACVFCLAVLSTVWFKVSAAPKIDPFVSARQFWREATAQQRPVCAGTMDRQWRYGLNYYFEGDFPDCVPGGAKLRIRQRGKRLEFQQPSAAP